MRMKAKPDDFEHDAQQAQWFSRRWADIMVAAPGASPRELRREIDEFEARIIQTTRTKQILNERLVGVVRLRLEIGFFKGEPIDVLTRLFRQRSKLGYINVLDEAEEASMYARMCLDRGATRRGAAVLSPLIKKLDAKEILLPWSIARSIREIHSACVSPPNKALQRTGPPRERKGAKVKAPRRRPRR